MNISPDFERQYCGSEYSLLEPSRSCVSLGIDTFNKNFSYGIENATKGKSNNCRSFNEIITQR